MDNRIRRVVEHLPDHLASDARICAALYLYQGGYTVLVEEQVVECPAVTAALLTRNTHLACNEQPSSRLLGINLIAGKKSRMLREQSLEKVLGVVRTLGEFPYQTALLNQVDAAVHRHSRLIGPGDKPCPRAY